MHSPGAVDNNRPEAVFFFQLWLDMHLDSRVILATDFKYESILLTDADTTFAPGARNQELITWHLPR